MRILTPAARTMMTVADGFWLMSGDMARRFPGPGQILERLPECIREELRNLKSEDIAGVRIEPWMGSETREEAWQRQIEAEARKGRPSGKKRRRRRSA
jgi:hypothetical protein